MRGFADSGGGGGQHRTGRSADPSSEQHPSTATETQGHDSSSAEWQLHGYPPPPKKTRCHMTGHKAVRSLYYCGLPPPPLLPPSPLPSWLCLHVPPPTLLLHRIATASGHVLSLCPPLPRSQRLPLGPPCAVRRTEPGAAAVPPPPPPPPVPSPPPRPSNRKHLARPQCNGSPRNRRQGTGALFACPTTAPLNASDNVSDSARGARSAARPGLPPPDLLERPPATALGCLMSSKSWGHGHGPGAGLANGRGHAESVMSPFTVGECSVLCGCAVWHSIGGGGEVIK